MSAIYSGVDIGSIAAYSCIRPAHVPLTIRSYKRVQKQFHEVQSRLNQISSLSSETDETLAVISTQNIQTYKQS